MPTLTDRQSEIVAFIRRFAEVEGYPPTATEIGRWLGVTKQTVAKHLNRLEALGALSRVPASGRTIKLEETKLPMDANHEG